MSDPFVPTDFEPPQGVIGDGFRLEPLGPEHNERDHAAWMSSIDHIRSTPGFQGRDDGWPVEMSLEDNRLDLVRHADDFESRRGFTYSILDDTDDVIGCVYIYPSDDPADDARVTSWVTERRSDLDEAVWETVSEWIADSWPFAHPDYAPRH